MKQITTQ
jgi:hypothetical protein